MKTMNVNGQNGVATSALKNAVVKAVKMINKAEIGKKTYVMIDEGLRLSFDGIRFIRGAKDNFIFNGKIEKKGSNGRYNTLVEIHYKNLDNEEGLCLNDMINGVLDDILNDIDNWIIDYYKSESSSKWGDGLEMYQNFRNKFFGSILVVDNTDNLNSPDTLESPNALDDNMTIREFYELHNDGYGCTADPINNYVDEFLSPDAVKTFFNLVEKDEDWSFYIDEDGDGDLYVSGNEGIYKTYFNDDVPMVQVYSYLMDKMNKEIIKIETEIEKEIEGAEYKVLDAFEITNAQGENSLKINYDEWWDYVLGETPDWIKDKYYDKFCDVLYYYFVKFAKDYDYGVEEIDGGISLEKPDYNN